MISLHYYAKIVQKRITVYNEMNINWLSKSLKKEVLIFKKNSMKLGIKLHKNVKLFTQF